MKVALIGGTGFVGRHIAKQLISENKEVIVFGSFDADLRLQSSQAILYSKILECEQVIILTGLTPKKKLSDTEQLIRYMDNLRIIENISSVLLDIDVKRILYISSDSVYSTTKSELCETDVTAPSDLYGLAHQSRERLLQCLFSKHSLLIVRPCALFGADDPHNGYGPNRFIREVVQCKYITLFGDGEEIRNHMYIEDFAKVIVALMEMKIEGIINVANQPAISFYDIAKQIESILPYKFELKRNMREMPIVHKVHNTARLNNLLPEFAYTQLAKVLELMYKDLVLQNKLRSSTNV